MIHIQPPVVQNWNSLVNKPSILSDNQISWDEIQNKPTTLTGYGITNGQPLGNELTALQSLADTPGFLKKTGNGTYSIDINSYLSLTGGTITGNLTVSGNITGSAGAGVSLYEGSGLGGTSGDFQVLCSKTGLSGTNAITGMNLITERTWLRRKANGGGWDSASLHNGIFVDVSFNIPGSTTRTWWERDIWAGIQSWGNGATTYFSVDSSRFHVPLSTPSTSPTTGASRVTGGQGIGGDQWVGGAVNTATFFRVGGTQVVSTRRTGWTAPTGTPTRTTFVTSTVTLTELAERVKALIDDLITHGLIGA